MRPCRYKPRCLKKLSLIGNLHFFSNSNNSLIILFMIIDLPIMLEITLTQIVMCSVAVEFLLSRK